MDKHDRDSTICGLIVTVCLVVVVSAVVLTIFRVHQINNDSLPEVIRMTTTGEYYVVRSGDTWAYMMDGGIRWSARNKSHAYRAASGINAIRERFHSSRTSVWERVSP